MNAIKKALQEIKFRIPKEVLDIGMKEYNANINKVISMDDRLISAVIRPRVMTDINLVGGVMVTIDLSKCSVAMLNDREYIIEVPKKLTGNKSIVSLLSIVSNVVHSSVIPYSAMPSTLNSSLNMMNNLDSVNVVQTSRLELIGDNIILVQDPTIHLMNGMLRCKIENDNNLNNLKPRSYRYFSKLCVLATKAYIYNQTVVKLDQGYIYGGHELSVVKDLIESYSEANDEYDEYMTEVIGKVMFMNDSESSSRFIKSMFGNTI